MRRTVLEELRQLRRRFAALAALVLALPILMSALPRDARSAALAEIGNAAICSISGRAPGPDEHPFKTPCENCLAGTACAAAPAKADAGLPAKLHPPRRLLGRLCGGDVQPKELLSASIRAARAPPAFL